MPLGLLKPYLKMVLDTILKSFLGLLMALSGLDKIQKQKKDVLHKASHPFLTLTNVIIY